MGRERAENGGAVKTERGGERGDGRCEEGSGGEGEGGRKQEGKVVACVCMWFKGGKRERDRRKRKRKGEKSKDRQAKTRRVN